MRHWADRLGASAQSAAPPALAGRRDAGATDAARCTPLPARVLRSCNQSGRVPRSSSTRLLTHLCWMSTRLHGRDPLCSSKGGIGGHKGRGTVGGTWRQIERLQALHEGPPDTALTASLLQLPLELRGGFVTRGMCVLPSLLRSPLPLLLPAPTLGFNRRLGTEATRIPPSGLASAGASNICPPSLSRTLQRR